MPEDMDAILPPQDWDLFHLLYRAYMVGSLVHLHRRRIRQAVIILLQAPIFERYIRRRHDAFFRSL